MILSKMSLNENSLIYIKTQMYLLQSNPLFKKLQWKLELHI